MDKTKFQRDVIIMPYGAKIIVWHDLPKGVPGWGFEDALAGWIKASKSHTALSLVNYIDNKQTEYTAFTEEQFNKL